MRTSSPPAQPTADGSGPPRTIWYMGAKARVLPGFLDEVLDRLLPRNATVLDLFSGTATVSVHCARRWRVIANDVQRYAQAIAQSLIERPPGGVRAFVRSLEIDCDLLPTFEKNRRTLQAIYAKALEAEAGILDAYGRCPGRGAPAALGERYRIFLTRPGGLYGESWKETSRQGQSRATAARDPIWRDAVNLIGEASMGLFRENPLLRPACLMTAYYANVYFGLRQAIDLDSLRAAIDEIPGSDPVAARKRVHYLAALIHTASVSTSGTSHFAQPRALRKDSELLAMARRRRIDVLETFRDFCGEITQALEMVDPGEGNRALCAEYGSLIRDEPSGAQWVPEVRADLVYMDPPYTADNYSRFYHVLEVLARYDYPALDRDARGCVTVGRYPEIGYRFQSLFCRPRTVEAEFARVIAASAGSGAKLVISYGTPNGLLLKVYRRKKPGRDPVLLLEDLCRQGYRSVETLRRRLLHSGQGDKNLATDELLVVCEGPR